MAETNNSVTAPDLDKESAASVIEELVNEVTSRINNSSTSIKLSEGMSIEEGLIEFEKRFNEIFGEDKEVRDVNTGHDFSELDIFENKDPFISMGHPEEPTTSGRFSKETGMQTEVNLGKDDLEASEVICLMRVLIEENKSLRKHVFKSERVLRYVMSKFRKSVEFFLEELKRNEDKYPRIGTDVEGKFQEECAKLSLRLNEMKEIMKKAIQQDDQAFAQYEEQLARIYYENQNLRELLEINKNIGGPKPTPDDKPLKKTTTAAQTQTGEEDDSVDKLAGANSVEENEDSADSDNDNYSLASEDSFHTADDAKSKSPFGSYASVFFEADDDAISAPPPPAEKIEVPFNEISVPPKTEQEQEQSTCKGSGDLCLE